MASITFDGQSFMLDGRRLWLVSGSIHYARVPRTQWAERIAAAKYAGLNMIELPLIWARHEPRQGHFDFQGDNDIRFLVQLIQKAGMHVFLRAGPYVDAQWDMGGLPPWLLGLNAAQGGIRLRTNQNVFLDACSRYITALAGQLRDLQVTSPTKGGAGGGPILLMQTETHWTCGDDALAASYLLEIDRYFREAGFGVPLVNSNDLWQSVEGEIDGWSGFDGLLSHLRQLASIRPTAPRFVTRFRAGRTRTWGQPAAPAHSPQTMLARLAEVLAAGGQFNIDPFFGGTNLGFSGGRDESAADAFLCASHDNGAPLSETGRPGASYQAVRQISTFASRFARLLAHLDARHTVALAPPTAAAGRPAVVHCSGSQGGVAFVFGGSSGEGGAGDKHELLSLLLPDGSTLPVDMAGQSVAWCLLDTRITARAQLDYCNLSAFAMVGKVFICFGVEGTRGLLSINGSPLEVTVPGGKEPFVHEHEGVTVVVASTRQLEQIALDDHAVYIGIEGFDAAGHPHAPAEARHYTRIDAEGQSKQIKVGGAGGSHGGHGHSGAHKPAHRKPALEEWTCATLTGYTSGSSARYASIKAPADLVALGAPYGYGWYRLKFASGSPRRVKVMFPQSAHRVHVTLDGEPAGVVGVGPGAANHATLSLKKGTHTLVMLAENLGRVSAGADLGDQTGLWGHAWCVEHLSLGKPKLVASEPVDILNFRAPLWRVHRDDMTDPMRLTWTMQYRRKTPVIMSIAPFESSSNGGIVLLDDRPIAYFPAGAAKTIVLDPDQLGRGKTEIQITMIGSTETEAAALTKAVSFEEGEDCLTARAEWAFAKWDQPGSESYHKPQRAEGHHGPLWWKSHFITDDSDAPVFFDATGLSKGQIYVNGRHVSRMWVGTAAGKKVPPQSRYLLPRPFLHAPGENNELVVFDEHGFAPTRCKLVVDPGARAFDE
jgi:hypothetical protein